MCDTAMIQDLIDKSKEMKQDLKRIGSVLDAVKSQECQGHYSTMIQQIIDRNKELERQQAVLVDALERLAMLGNGARYGNSEGNEIAIAALAALAAMKGEKP